MSKIVYVCDSNVLVFFFCLYEKMTFGNSTLPQRPLRPSSFFNFNGVFEALAENTGIPPNVTGLMLTGSQYGPPFLKRRMTVKNITFKKKEERKKNTPRADAGVSKSFSGEFSFCRDAK